MASFWSIWVIVLTVITFVGMTWLLFANRKREQKLDEKTTGHVYDGIAGQKRIELLDADDKIAARARQGDVDEPRQRRDRSVEPRAQRPRQWSPGQT